MQTRRINATRPWIIAMIFCCVSRIPLAAAGTLDGGVELDSFQYRESGYMQENGVLLGGYAAYTSTLASNIMWRVFLSCAGGSLDYEGSTMGGTPLEFNTPNTLMNLRALLGYQVQWVTPFTGIGVRLIDDDLSSAYPYGYERRTTYLYSPLGVEICKVFRNKWTLGTRAEYDLFWGGLNRNLDFPFASGTTTIELHQHSGYGIQGVLFLKRSVSPALRLSVETFVHYWDIDQSDSVFLYDPTSVYELYEPSNQCAIYGLRAGMSW